MEIRWAYVLAVSFLLTYLLMPVAILIGNKMGALDFPEERKIHAVPTPTTGGLAIFVAYFVTLLRNLNFSMEIKGVLLGTSIIFFTGVLDDKYDIPARIKLLLQIVATIILIVFGVKVKIIPHNFPAKDFFDIIITFIGVVGITNAFNYLDGMNGEASGLAAISGLTLFAISLSNGARHISWLAIALVGCCLGFLPFNFAKSARIFLGDSGSTTIGFLLAAIAIAGSWSASSIPIAIVTPVLIFSIYIFDMIYTTVSRIKSGIVKNVGQWFAVTGKDHLHHRLTNLGFTQKQAVVVIWGCSMVFSFSAFVIRNSEYINAVVIVIQCLLVYFLIVVLMLVGKERAEKS
ncbi:glycosyltransferase family 4 protein [Elusimicrobiota bacterium]